MNGSEDTGESDPLDIDLAEFIQDRSALLVVMGVFAAIAVYISDTAPELGTNTDSQLMYATGFVAAFGMAILLLCLVYKELAAEIGSWNRLHHAHYRLNNLPLAFFTLLNTMLILSISYLMARYEAVLFMLLLIAALFAGGGIVLRALYAIGRYLPQTAWARIPAMFFFSVVSGLASHYIITEYLSGVKIVTIQKMSFTDPMPVVTAVAYILVASIRSAAALCVFVAIIGTPIVLIDKIRGKSLYDNPK
ncbi:hypothetical protein SAMN05216388_103827 [Halorientalis persicus]|uniref:Uncharacterized protein n=1 Tax=Halorientalis persicus TaxID=1367881 RepID=A0A1H8VJM3_9EURY|nr:hypothetical protein [Halorientalis persicus]SEP15494.1 hypothetical protein SAMN05216388_103827 [Halorientalis persicus]